VFGVLRLDEQCASFDLKCRMIGWKSSFREGETFGRRVDEGLPTPPFPNPKWETLWNSISNESTAEFLVARIASNGERSNIARGYHEEP
jgi:hypothetical protein